MKKKTISKISADKLEKFARKVLQANKYPQNPHIFKILNCKTCGPIDGLTVHIEHHTGSSKEDFKGKITAKCHNCKKKQILVSFTGPSRKKIAEDIVVCPCGNQKFLIGEFERFSDSQELVGFFEEGIIVGECDQCQHHQVLAQTD